MAPAAPPGPPTDWAAIATAWVPDVVMLLAAGTVTVTLPAAPPSPPLEPVVVPNKSSKSFPAPPAPPALIAPMPNASVPFVAIDPA